MHSVLLLYGLSGCFGTLYPSQLSVAASIENTQFANDWKRRYSENGNTTNVWQFILSVIGVVGGLITVAIGLVTYRRSETLKKKDIMKDIIVPLINEFDSTKFKIAKDLLDNKSVPRTHNTSQGEASEYYTRADLNQLLRDRRSEDPRLLTEDEKKIREAFDAFLNFLVKLEYLLIVKILDKENELDYFKYFIDQAAGEQAVVNFVSFYKFPLRGKLNRRLVVGDI